MDGSVIWRFGVFSFFKMIKNIKQLFIITTFLSGINILCYAGELPDTGQATGYGTGDDADYNPVATQMSYMDNSDGTVTDNLTGLMWLQDANYYNGGASQTWEQALSGCESFSYAGYSDWRLPNMKELLSIVKYEGSAPLISTTYFLNNQINFYWTSTTVPGNPTIAIDVNFDSGEAYGNDKTDAYYVRPVRGGQ
ncbi:DUF1566 domain-containing protein [bacterium]|nr:DUF1566 domain-containing protein [Candidatus Omnitrophota bacterium]MBU2528123.1 DUF1566 domain-containing protein [bacterium]MBU3929501.1 DUF1566 domain-containing protein [bacterium]MBU4122712.1 DUF1566 domain-containing protein [bacterium]